MAVQTRPYFVIFNDKERMVEATSPAQAVRHVVGAAVTELRPARGGEVSAWMKAGKPMEDANARGEPRRPASEIVDEVNASGTAVLVKSAGDAELNASGSAEQLDRPHVDVIAWVYAKLDIDEGEVLSKELGDKLSLVSLSAVANQLTLETFDEIRAFADLRFLREAIVLYSPLGAGSIDSIRTYLGEQPMAWSMVEQACAQYDRDDTHWSDREKRAEHAAKLENAGGVADEDAQDVEPEMKPVKSKPNK